ncbi:MAG: hypothetical protein ACLRFI_00700 [Alphaproteobacteria bacterium]
MLEARDNSILTQRDYNIAGNFLRAYYDDKNKLVFVIDTTITETKPNTLLVINTVGNRKWDDVLANDYGVNLEFVRPKEDNKYQKLDIEYSGLNVYDNLINAYLMNKDVDNALSRLNEFRVFASRKNAQDRLEQNQKLVDNAHQTIDNTMQTIDDLNKKIKLLRSKLSEQKKNVGHEPTKQSAAKILKTEAQIEDSTEKLNRAKKRLENARHRLANAQDDISQAEIVLQKLGNNNTFSQADNNFDDDIDYDSDDYEEYDDEIIDDDEDVLETDDDNSNTEIKPLFDKDPQILNEDIAFKPVSFSGSDLLQDSNKENDKIDKLEENNQIEDSTDVLDNKTEQNTEIDLNPQVVDTSAIMNNQLKPIEQNKQTETPVVLDDTDNKEFTFVPPMIDLSGINDTMPEEETKQNDFDVEPVVDGVGLVPPMIDMPDNNDAEYISNEKMVEQQPEKTNESLTTNIDENKKPIVNSIKSVDVIQKTNPAVMKRPLSPTYQEKNIQEYNAPEQRSFKTNKLYYVLLVFLIVLSVFALWMYQKTQSNVKTTPALVANVATENNESQTDDFTSESNDDLFITATESNQVETIDGAENLSTDKDLRREKIEKNVDNFFKSVTNDNTKNSINTIDDSKNQPEESLNNSENQITQPIIEENEIVDTENNFLIEQQNEKPEYDVSTESNIITDDDTGSLSCADGNEPDEDGCCAGETLTDMSDGSIACCPNDGGECFPPML